MAQPMNSNGIPTSGGHRKKGKLDPKWKVRLQALVLILLLVIPGNLVTLIIYSSSSGGDSAFHPCLTVLFSDCIIAK